MSSDIPWRSINAAAQRDDKFVWVCGRSPGRHQFFLQVPGFGEEVPAQPDKHDHPGEEEEEIAYRIYPALRLHGPVLVEEIGPDVLSQVEGHGRCDEKVGPVEHGGHVHRPERGTEGIADEHLPDQHSRHRDDQPGYGSSRPQADPVNYLCYPIDVVHISTLQLLGTGPISPPIPRVEMTTVRRSASPRETTCPADRSIPLDLRRIGRPWQGSVTIRPAI